MVASEAHAAAAGDQRHRHHQHADADVQIAGAQLRGAEQRAHQLRGPVADQKNQPVQRPEQAGGEAAWIMRIAPGEDGDHQQNQARQPHQILLLKH